MIAILRIFFLFTLAGPAVADGAGTIVCTFKGSGMDAVYTIRCRAGRTVLFEAPAAIERFVVGDKANWLAARQDSRLWLQPRLGGLRTSLFILSTAPGAGCCLFCFEMIEAGPDCGGECAERVDIVTGLGGAGQGKGQPVGNGD